MDIFPLLMVLFIGWIIFSNVKAAGKGLEKASKSAGKSDEWRKNISTIQARVKEYAARDEFEVSPELEDDWSYERQSYRKESGNTSFGKRSSNRPPAQRGHETLQKRLQAATKSKALKQARGLKSKPREQGRGADYGLNMRHAPQKDQNRHRRDDWGTRGGEIITTQSLLVLLALGFIVLYALSKISPSDLGL